MDKKLLVPLDGTAFSRQVLTHVRRLFGVADTQLHLLRVMEAPVGAGDALFGPALFASDYTLYTYPIGAERGRHPLYDDQDWEAYRLELAQALRQDASPLQEDGYDVSITVHFGDPVEEIVSFVQENQVDLIAMATHGRKGLGRLFAGSVAQDVFSRVDLPMLLVRAEDIAGEGTEER